MGNFDDLVNDFFDSKKSNPVKDEVKKIIDSIAAFTQKGDSLDDAVIRELGEPDAITEIYMDGFLHTQHIWNTPHGKFVKYFASNIVVDKEITLQELQAGLKNAEEAEDYEMAIKIRDEIKALKAAEKNKSKKNDK